MKTKQKTSRKAERARIKRLSSTRQKGYTIYGQPAAEYLQSSEWAEVKRRYFASNLRQDCVVCAAPHEPAFFLHHRRYERLGAEYLGDLMPVCPDCREVIVEAYRLAGSEAESLGYMTRRIADEYRAKHPELPPHGATLSTCWKCDEFVQEYHDYVRDESRDRRQYSHVDCSKVTFKSKQKKSR